jgi:hypothetical protein
VARLRKLPDEEAFKLLEEYNIPIPAYSIVETLKRLVSPLRK